MRFETEIQLLSSLGTKPFLSLAGYVCKSSRQAFAVDCDGGREYKELLSLVALHPAAITAIATRVSRPLDKAINFPTGP